MMDHPEGQTPDIAKRTEIPPIDLKEVIRKKNPALMKWMPGIVFNYLKRIVHLDEINDFLARKGHLKGLDFVKAGLDEFGAEVVVEGLEHLPFDKRFIIASNHPLGGLDGLALIHVIGQRRKDVVFPVNDILMNVPNISELFIPINKHGSNATNIRIIEDTFASERAMLYFPAGLCSRKQSGKIIDLEWKKTIITKARKHKRYIVPVFIEGRNTNFFYNMARLRAFFRIKANIEMLYLVDEMFKQKEKEIKICFGKAIPHEFFDARYNDREWIAFLKKYVYQELRYNAEAEFTPPKR